MIELLEAFCQTLERRGGAAALGHQPGAGGEHVARSGGVKGEVLLDRGHQHGIRRRRGVVHLGKGAGHGGDTELGGVDAGDAMGVVPGCKAQTPRRCAHLFGGIYGRGEKSAAPLEPAPAEVGGT